MTLDRPILGIALMLGFCIVAPIGDAVAKVLGASVPLGMVVAIRFAVQAIVLIPLVWWSGRMWRMRGRVLALTALRTVLHVLGIAAMFTALKFLPLADAVAIVFVMPFFMLVLGHYVLHEEVGPRRLIACSVGFLGTLMIVQPSFATVGWPALLPVFVAANFSVFMLVTRQIAKETDPIGLQAVSGVMAVVLMAPILWWGSTTQIAALELITPTAQDWSLLLAIGLLGTVAHLLMTWSLRYAPSTTLAPMQYLEIPFATALGFVVFRDLPDPLATLGIGVTMGAGLYIILRERTTAQHLAATTAPQPAE
ncbi:DMT family transporter [Sulfitobacter sp. TSTF-M16]|uniref:DMT family transporter n=1 Tax=Sulfitobacter aestuariivivens TaxID=2766981 RepID=A0A927HDI8_9RHOB|nr:DMT family transporter [Sulfitobacter aestuariivivens]MBD3662378.1 DMT family transporter [Sulfitobacter aestuariivivens]